MHKYINKTRLKKKILENCSSDYQEQSDSMNTLVVFNEGLQHILKESIQNRDCDSEAIILGKSGKINKERSF